MVSVLINTLNTFPNLETLTVEKGEIGGWGSREPLVDAHKFISENPTDESVSRLKEMIDRKRAKNPDFNISMGLKALFIE